MQDRDAPPNPIIQQLTAQNALIGALAQQVKDQEQTIADLTERLDKSSRYCAELNRRLTPLEDARKRKPRPRSKTPAIIVETDQLARIFAHMTKLCGRNFQATHPDGSRTHSAELLANLLKRGYSEQQILGVCGNRWVKWKDDEKMQGYFRPATLFAPAKFVEYLAHLGVIES